MYVTIELMTFKKFHESQNIIYFCGKNYFIFNFDDI